jgi:integrase
MPKPRSPRVWLLSEYDGFTKLEKAQAKYYDEFAFVFPFKSKSGREYAWTSINHPKFRHRRESCSKAGLLFIPENKQVALRILLEKLTEKEPDESEWTVMRAFIEYHKTYADELGKSERGALNSAIKVFLTKEIKDIPLSNPPAIRAGILKIKKDAKTRTGEAFAPATLHTYMHTVRKIFNEAIKLEKATVNPVFLEDMPSIPPAVGNPWGYIEFLKFLYWQQQNAPKIVANAFEFISYFGTRAFETVQLKLSEFDNRQITIDGKRSRADKPKIRTIAVRLIPGGAEALERFKKDSKNEYLFSGRKGHITKWTLNYWLNRWKDINKIENDKDIHEIRDMALNMWEEVFKLPVTVREEMAGHSEKVYKEKYRKKVTAEWLENMSA